MNPVRMGSFQRSWLLLVFDSLLFSISALPADDLTNGNKVYLLSSLSSDRIQMLVFSSRLSQPSEFPYIVCLTLRSRIGSARSLKALREASRLCSKPQVYVQRIKALRRGSARRSRLRAKPQASTRSLKAPCEASRVCAKPQGSARSLKAPRETSRLCAKPQGSRLCSKPQVYMQRIMAPRKVSRLRAKPQGSA